MNEEDEAFEDLAKRQGDWGMQGSRKHQIMRYAENVESKGTNMTDKEVIKKMYQLLLTEPHAPTLCDQLENIAREALAQPEQEPVAHLWECLGRWSAYLVNNGTQAECAPPQWLCDAVKNATTPPQRTEQEPTPKIKYKMIVIDDLHPQGIPVEQWVNPPQRTEHNFCSRCGKRTPDLITIHTCTPPKETT
jgi:hypothetical protein